MITKIRINDEWITLLANTASITDRMAIIEQRLDELTGAIEFLQQAIAPSTNVASVEPKEKSDLEILNTIDDSIKNNYIDLDDIANGKELWEPHDANWWNK